MDAASSTGEKRVPPSAVTRMVLTWLGAASSDTPHAANTNGGTCANVDSPAIGSCVTKVDVNQPSS